MAKERLLLATTNKGKAKEIKSFLQELPLEIISLAEWRLKETFAEKGETFAENAREKSLFYSRRWEGLTLTEDSGLEIDELHGAPGIFSARFSGPQATDKKNIEKVLKLMKDIPFSKRKARFISSMAVSRKGKVIKEINESVQGFITFEKRGNQGFGYDPVFYYPPLEKTFAQLSAGEKNKVSHRGRALKKLKEFLLEYL